ncbi:MAG: DUF2461 domain-containing protein [Chitinophagales bacterium]|nr:DUF2461 domain-containing protein [Chitinophagales bacterium]
MAVTSVSSSSLQFLRDLKENNNRPWFNENKSRYQEAQAEMAALAESLIERMNEHDELEPVTGKKSLFRIYRDVRFSKDKSPYKTHLSGSLVRATKWRRGGYYFHVEPGASFIGGGFWAPNKEDLLRIRQEIAMDAKPLRKIITAPSFIETFDKLEGDQLKTAPKGFDRDHPDIDLLRYKQFLLSSSFTDEEVCSHDFVDKMNAAFQNMRPFFDFMSDVLTTDMNGVPIE